MGVSNPYELDDDPNYLDTNQPELTVTIKEWNKRRQETEAPLTLLSVLP